MLNKCVFNINEKVRQIQIVTQIDIHKSLLLYEEDNGPGKHED
jgi:hypothetical protein